MERLQKTVALLGVLTACGSGANAATLHLCRDQNYHHKYFHIQPCPADDIISLQSAVVGYSTLYLPGSNPPQCPWLNCTRHSPTSVPATLCDGRHSCQIPQSVLVYPQGRVFHLCPLSINGNFIRITYACNNTAASLSKTESTTNSSPTTTKTTHSVHITDSRFADTSRTVFTKTTRAKSAGNQNVSNTIPLPEGTKPTTTETTTTGTIPRSSPIRTTVDNSVNQSTGVHAGTGSRTTTDDTLSGTTTTAYKIAKSKSSGSPDESIGYSLPSGALGGVVVGSVLFLLVVAMLIGFLLCRRGARKSAEETGFANANYELGTDMTGSVLKVDSNISSDAGVVSTAQSCV